MTDKEEQQQSEVAPQGIEDSGCPPGAHPGFEGGTKGSLHEKAEMRSDIGTSGRVVTLEDLRSRTGCTEVLVRFSVTRRGPRNIMREAHSIALTLVEMSRRWNLFGNPSPVFVPRTQYSFSCAYMRGS